jgi:hypothetical protein
VEKRFRDSVAVDKTVVKLHGLRAYVWSAVDVDSEEVLAIYASWSRNMLIALKFLRTVLGRCINKPLVDRGPWYRWTLERLGLKHRYQRFGLRNAAERFFVKEVLESNLGDDVRYKAAREGWRSIDIERDEGIPAYLFKIVNYLLGREGFKREYLDTLIRISLSLPDPFIANFTVMRDEIGDVEALFDYVVSCGELTADDKISFLAVILMLRDIRENVRLRFYERFLRSD